MTDERNPLTQVDAPPGVDLPRGSVYWFWRDDRDGRLVRLRNPRVEPDVDDDTGATRWAADWDGAIQVGTPETPGGPWTWRDATDDEHDDYAEWLIRDLHDHDWRD